jgi:capsular polysaccharide biosynthesis protein
MKPEFRTSKAMMWSLWVYQRLLAAYPRQHRKEYGAAMAQLFRDQYRDAWQWRRGWGLALLWLRTLPELAKTSLWERITSTKKRETMFKKAIGGTGEQSGLIGVFISVFLTVFLGVVLVVTLITFILPVTYVSRARIKVERDVTDIPGVGNRPSTSGNYDPYFIQTEFEVLQSERILDQVIDRLDLKTVWQKKYSQETMPKKSECRIMLKRMIEFRPTRNTSLIDINVYSDDKLEAARIANTIAEVYVDFRREQQKVLLAGPVEGYKKLREEIRNDLAAKPNEAKLDDARLAEILAQLKQSDSSAAQGIQMWKVEIIEHAQPAYRPVRPNKPLNIFLGIILGGMLGLITAGLVVMLMSRGRRKVLMPAASAA